MTPRTYVIRACQMLKIELVKPTKGCPGILGTHWHNGFGSHVIDANTWEEAKKQVDTWRAAWAYALAA